MAKNAYCVSTTLFNTGAHDLPGADEAQQQHQEPDVPLKQCTVHVFGKRPEYKHHPPNVLMRTSPNYDQFREHHWYASDALKQLKFANGEDMVTQLQGLITSNKWDTIYISAPDMGLPPNTKFRTTHDIKVNKFLLSEEEVYVDIPTEVYGSTWGHENHTLSILPKSVDLYCQECENCKR